MNPKDYPQWVENPNKRGQWTLSMFPLTLIMEFHEREEKQYVGSIKGAGWTLKDHFSWSSSAEASKGMLVWAKEKMSEGYHLLDELDKMMGG